MIEQFEVQLQQYRQQIEELENHLATQANNSHITPQGKNTHFNILINYIMQDLYETGICGQKTKGGGKLSLKKDNTHFQVHPEKQGEDSHEPFFMAPESRSKYWSTAGFPNPWAAINEKYVSSVDSNKNYDFILQQGFFQFFISHRFIHGYAENLSNICSSSCTASINT